MIQTLMWSDHIVLQDESEYCTEGASTIKTLNLLMYLSMAQTIPRGCDSFSWCWSNAWNLMFPGYFYFYIKLHYIYNIVEIILNTV